VKLVVEPRHAGLRLDQLLAVAGGLSRRRARLLIGAGAVRRNGELTRVQGRQVAAYDVVEVDAAGALPATAGAASGAPHRIAEPLAAEVSPGEARHEESPRRDSPRAGEPGKPLPTAPVAEPAVLPVLFHDSWLLAVAKPAGVLSQPAERRVPGDLAMDELAAARLAWELGGPPFLRLVHRLDRVTSGVLLFARSPAALPPLTAAWSDGRVERRYLAAVEGELPPGLQRVETAIARDPRGGWRFVALPGGGREAVTEIETLAVGGGLSLVACRLRTGRTHQVRVHLAHLGHPVAGDRLYGSTTDVPRPLLHAASLRLPHPEHGRDLRIEAPLPADLAAVAAGLGWQPQGAAEAAGAPASPGGHTTS
jgi:23S rRNA pseudouridine1911/1915/1917 synthase